MARKHETQTDFYPAWRERLDELRARLRSIEPPATGLSPRRWEQVRELIMAIAAHEDSDRKCRQPAEKLLATAARGTGTLGSIAQLYAARREAERLGLVGVQRDYAAGRGAGRRDDQLWIVESQIDELAEATRELRRRQPCHDNQRQVTLNNANQRETTRTNGAFSKHLAKPNAQHSNFNQSSFSLPSDPSARTADTAGSAGARSPVANEWDEVEEEVFLSGVNDARNAVRCARSQGARPAEILGAIAWWQPRRGAWDQPEAVLWRRLRRWSRSTPISEGWDRTRPGWVDAARVAASQAAHAVRCAEGDAARAAAAEERRRLAALKAELGPELELLADGELAQLMQEAASLACADQGGAAAMLKFYRSRGKASPAVELDLLLALDKRRAHA